MSETITKADHSGMRRLELLDVGRFVAACCVVAFHYSFNGISSGKIASLTHIPSIVDFTKYGYLGVEFFFMISGYVIFFSARTRTAGEFAVSRAVRLYPAFWVAVMLTSAAAVFWGGPLMSVHPMQVLANLTMIPDLLGYEYVDGVYWTLQLELFFYAAVLLGLMLGLQKRLDVLFLSLPFALALAAALVQLPYLGTYYAYFAAGAVFAIQKSRPSFWSFASLATCCGLCVAFAVKHAASMSEQRGIEFSALVVGLVIAAQFAFFFALNLPRVSALRIPGSKLLGGLTYPLYLIHQNIGYMILSRFATDDSKALWYPVTIAVAFGITYLIHMHVERRFASTWHALFERAVGMPVQGIVTGVSAGVTLLRRAWRT